MHEPPAFFGRQVVRATFLMAMLGWGIGFYGPPIFLHAVVQRTGWSLALVSAAVTVHYLFGALIVTRLPALHRRFGVGPTAVAGAIFSALGVIGWSVASAPWHLFTSALVSGGGWVAMGAVAVNAAIAPWFVRTRPVALANAYNGASIGGVVFSPLWVLLIAQWGFTASACIVGLAVVLSMSVLSRAIFTKTPEQLGQRPDGDSPGAVPLQLTSPEVLALPGRQLWRSRQFQTLALGMAAGLFAQIGLLAHLFSLLVPALGAQSAGLAMGFATACAIGGRAIAARVLRTGADRRIVAALAYVVQLMGTAVLMLADGSHISWILIGVALFGSGIGNATSLPPLIAQTEFAKHDVPRAVALIVAMGQATYAFAPAAFGLVLALESSEGPRLALGSTAFFFSVAAIQGLAIASFLAGRRAK